MSALAIAHLALQLLATSLAAGAGYMLPTIVVFRAWAQGQPAEGWPRLQRAGRRVGWVAFGLIAAAIWWNPR